MVPSGTVANGAYTADRWSFNFVGTGVVTITQETATVPDGTTDIALSVDITTADAALGAGDFYTLNTKVEGYDALKFALGKADAKMGSFTRLLQ